MAENQFQQEVYSSVETHLLVFNSLIPIARRIICLNSASLELDQTQCNLEDQIADLISVGTHLSSLKNSSETLTQFDMESQAHEKVYTSIASQIQDKVNSLTEVINTIGPLIRKNDKQSSLLCKQCRVFFESYYSPFLDTTDLKEEYIEEYLVLFCFMFNSAKHDLLRLFRDIKTWNKFNDVFSEMITHHFCHVDKRILDVYCRKILDTLNCTSPCPSNRITFDGLLNFIKQNAESK